MTAAERREIAAAAGAGGADAVLVGKGGTIPGSGTHTNHVRSNSAAMKIRYTPMPMVPSSLRSSLAVPSKCKVEGDGLRTSIVRQMASFTIVALDAADQQLTVGGDGFKVELRGSSALRARVCDNEDGTYTCRYFPSTSGKYTASVTLNGISLPGSPFTLNVLAARPDAANCVLRGDALHSATAREPAAFEISFVDSLGQFTHAEDIDVFVQLLPPTDDGTDPLDRLTSDYKVSYDRECRRAEKRAKAEQAALEASESQGGSAPTSQRNEPPTISSSDGGGASASRKSVAGKPEKKSKGGAAEEAGSKPAPLAAEEKALPADEEDEPEFEEDLSMPYSDAPTDEVLRSVGGHKPLIVRTECDLDSAQVGMLAVGGVVRVVEARETGSTTRAKVELQLCDVIDVDATGVQTARFSSFGSPRSPQATTTQRLHESSWQTPGDVRPGSALHDPLPSMRGVGGMSSRGAHAYGSPCSSPTLSPSGGRYSPGSPGSTSRQFAPAHSFTLPMTTLNGAPQPLLQRLRCFRPDRAHREAWVGHEGQDEHGADADRNGSTASAPSIFELMSGTVSTPTRKPPKQAPTHEVDEAPRYGWVTAIKQGTTFLTPIHEQLDAGERQRHLTLWARRKSIDNQTKANQTKGAANDKSSADNFEPSQAHELANDKAGFAFAFGGVDPGVLHARGQIVRHHTVRYSVGLSGRYRLHVGLRKEGVALPGSPFLLNVSPGAAHAPSTRIELADLPLKGGVGMDEDDGCTIRIQTSDRMGNHCTAGGAKVEVALDKHTRSNKQEGAGESDVQSHVLDHHDGSYTLSWRSEISGTFPVRVTINHIHISGSPTVLTLAATVPDVSQCVASGDGLNEARAGLPAAIQVMCKDKYGNVAQRSQTMLFGLVLVPQGKDEGGGGGKERAQGKELAKDAVREGANHVIANASSMDFAGAWVEGDGGEAYHISYTAQEAGDFYLHLWMDPEGTGVRKSVVGSPFAVRVSGVRASPQGSSLGGVEKYQLTDEPAASSPGSEPGTRAGRASRLSTESAAVPAEPRMAVLPAGERLVLRPQLRDEYGNASYASDGALAAWIIVPDKERVELQLKQFSQLGAYEISYDPHTKGLYSAHVELHGQPITSSPFFFNVTPGPSVGSKSRLAQITDPAVVNEPCELRLEAVDKYGNFLDVGGSTIGARAIGTSVSQPTFEDNNDGTYSLFFTSTVEGEGRVIVRLDNMEMAPVIVQFIEANAKKSRGSTAAEPGRTTPPDDSERSRA